MKRSIPSIVLCLLCLMSAADSVHAQAAKGPAATSTPGQPGFLIADMDMANVRVISHSDRTYRIRFDLVNKVPAVSGVRYGVVLVSDQSVFVDQEVYDDVLDIPENTTLTRTVDYSIPDNLEGRFSLVVKAKNGLGIPLASGAAGEVDARRVATGGELAITPTGCTPAGLELVCDVSSTFPGMVSAMAVVELYKGSLYGEKVQNGATTTAVSIISTSHQKISVPMPQPSEPGRYAVRVSFASGDSTSNAVSVSFSVAGKAGMVDFFSLDKGAYKEGETIHATLLWSRNPARNLDEAILAPQARIVVSSGSRECARADVPLRQGLTIATSSFPSLIDCPQASADVTLLDGTDALTASEYMKHPSSNGPSLLVIAFGALGVVIAAAAFYWFRRRGGGSAIDAAKVLLILCAVGAGLFGFAHQSEAATFVYYTDSYYSDGVRYSDGSCGYYYCTRYAINVSLDKSTYKVGFDPVKTTVDWLAYDDNYRTVVVAPGAGAVSETLVNHYPEVGYGYLASGNYIQDVCSWYGSPFSCTSPSGQVAVVGVADGYNTHTYFKDDVALHASDPNYFNTDSRTYVDPVFAFARIIPANAWTTSSSNTSQQVGSGSSYVIYYSAVTELSMNSHSVLWPVGVDYYYAEPGSYYMPITVTDQFNQQRNNLGAGGGGAAASSETVYGQNLFTVYTPITLTRPDTYVDLSSVSCNSISGHVYDSSNSSQTYSVLFSPSNSLNDTTYGADNTVKPLVNGNALLRQSIFTLSAGNRGATPGAFTLALDAITPTDGSGSLDFSNTSGAPRAVWLKVVPMHSFRPVYHSYSYQTNSVDYYNSDGSYNSTREYGKVFASNTSFTMGKSSWSDFASAASAATFLNSFTTTLGHPLYANSSFGNAYWYSSFGNSSELVNGFPQSSWDLARTANNGVANYEISLPACASTAPAVSIVAAPPEVAYGASINLSWTSQNTTSCAASNQVANEGTYDSGTWHGSRATTGTEAVVSSGLDVRDTGSDVDFVTFTVACTGQAGTATSSVQVKVTDLPDVPVAYISVGPDVVSFQGETVGISSSAINSTSCTASDTRGLWSGNKDPAGAYDEITLSGASVGDTLTLHCVGPLGSSDATATVLIDQCPYLDGSYDSTAQSAIPVGGSRVGNNCISPLSVTLEASPTSLSYSGGHVFLLWSARGATLCTASDTLGLWTGSKSATLNNSASVTLGHLSDAFGISCTDGSNTVNASASTTVDQCDSINGAYDPTVQTSIPSGMTRNDTTGACSSDSFTLGPDEELKISFPTDASAISERKALEVSPLGYASSVSLSVTSGPTLPGTTTIEYSFDNGATFSSNPTGVISPSGTISFKARVSKKVVNTVSTQYPIVIRGVSVSNSSVSATKTLYLNGRSSQQIFEEI